MDKDTLNHILNILRKGTLTWHCRNECLNRGRRRKLVGTFKNGKDKYVWERKCDTCDTWYALKDNLLEVDHIDEVGPYKGNLHEFALRMYCSPDNLQALCFSCHKKKTAIFNSSLRFKRKIKEEVIDSYEYL